MEFDFEEIPVLEQSESELPKISSPAAVAIDTINGRILYSKNAYSRRQMASTTKMMTAILAIEKGDLNDIVTVSKRAAYVGGSQAHLKVGEKIKLEYLLYALMLPSGNDAAIAIAEHIAGNVENFVAMMDEKALEIGAKNTKYGSPHGLDRNNYSTAYDLAIIARYCLTNPIFAEVVKTKSKVVPREGMENGKEYTNTNEMLHSYEGADGVKTGYTGPAGRCLVTSATRDGWQVISVVLGANSKYSRSNDSRKILNYVFSNFPLITVLPDGQEMISIPVVKGKKEKVYAINKGEISMHLNDTELANIEREFIVPEQLTAPIKRGQKIGKVVLRLGESPIGSCELYAKEDVAFWTIDMNLSKILKQWMEMNKLLQKYIKI
ncbi:D-alanyl-D-alanine carboxypeptidase family protein [Petroclostridium xylanilyticum]|uniref:D-alanyl-D-alanine carboxypeptidase family protein n=1 Tax=Petroclostridium xylanilyticum TaxID=1792311 RepID=UPI0018E3C816|nr:D-alanyl-D-alanine carboxypeptidase family protein [Petroclostridium xylanilyticum]